MFGSGGHLDRIERRRDRREARVRVSSLKGIRQSRAERTQSRADTKQSTADIRQSMADIRQSMASSVDAIVVQPAFRFRARIIQDSQGQM